MRRRSKTEVKILTTAKEKPIKEAINFYLGGAILVITLEDGSQMLVNKGAQNNETNLPINWEATFLAEFAIFGPIVVLKGDAKWGPNDVEWC